MSLYNPAAGKRSNYDKILDTTGKVDVYEITNVNLKAVIDSIWVSSAATGATLTLSIENADGLVFPILVEQPVDQQTIQPMVKDYHRILRDGEKITAQAGTADELAVSVALVEGGSN